MTEEKRGPQPSARVAAMPSFLAMDVLETAHVLERQGRKIIHFEVGEPDFDTPEPVRRAAAEAMAAGETHYTHSMGLWELRCAVSDHYRVRYGADVDPERVIVTSGSSPALLLAFLALLNPGDEALLTNPHYACYPQFISFAGGVPKYVPVREEEAFQFVPAELSRFITPRTRSLLLNSPANPTGTLISRERMEEVAKIADSHGLTIVSDEIYHGLVYEGSAHSILEFTDNAIVVNGFSKLHAMTGWRLGYLIVPPALARPVQKLSQNFLICANSFVQRAGVAALTSIGPEIAEMVKIYSARRSYMIERLERMGFSFKVKPTGAFYVFTDARWLDPDCYRLAFDILNEAGVGCTPGVDFGSGGEGYIRFTYANSLENIKEGMDRLAAYVAAKGRLGA